MIKIIEPGTRTVTECTECGCKLSYENEDIEKDGLFANNSVFFLGKLGLYVLSAVKKLY